MAKPPDWLDKVNYIVDFWADPCHAPIIVYIELAQDPLADAVLAWFSFGLSDILRGYLRPSKALGGSSFKRRGKEKKTKSKFWKKISGRIQIVRAVPGIGDDVGNWIGKQLPGANEIKGRAISQGERLLWMIDDLGQRALLALLIADIAIDFLYDWCTLVAQTEYCKRDRQDSLYASGPGTSAGIIFICNAADGATTVFSEGAVAWAGNTGTFGPGDHTVVSALDLTNINATPINHHQEIGVNDALGNRTLVQAPQTVGPFQSFGSVFSVNMRGPGSFIVSHCAQGGVVTSQHQDLTIWGGGFT